MTEINWASIGIPEEIKARFEKLKTEYGLSRKRINITNEEFLDYLMDYYKQGGLK